MPLLRNTSARPLARCGRRGEHQQGKPAHHVANTTRETNKPNTAVLSSSSPSPRHSQAHLCSSVSSNHAGSAGAQAPWQNPYTTWMHGRSMIAVHYGPAGKQVPSLVVSMARQAGGLFAISSASRHSAQTQGGVPPESESDWRTRPGLKAHEPEPKLRFTFTAGCTANLEAQGTQEDSS